MDEGFSDVGFAEAEAVAEEGAVFHAAFEPFCEGAGRFAEALEVEVFRGFGAEDAGSVCGDAAAADADLADIVHEFGDEAEFEAGGSEGVDAAIWFVEDLGGFEGVVDVVVGVHGVGR